MVNLYTKRSQVKIAKVQFLKADINIILPLNYCRKNKTGKTYIVKRLCELREWRGVKNFVCSLPFEVCVLWKVGRN